ncbi:MAG: PEP-CTERM sorting domain-containing protein [Armatimonadota bacterium]
MKKAICILLVVIAMMGLQAAANSATLQAGWYVHLNQGLSVWKDVWDPINHYYYQEGFGGGHFSTPAGHYGPFEVSFPYDLGPDVVVGETQNATPADSLRLPFTINPGVTNAHISFAWGANYDPTQMQLTLWKVLNDGASTQIWSAAGATGPADIYEAVASSNYYFLVSVVPEPSSLCALGVACLSMVGLATRRRAWRA